MSGNMLPWWRNLWCMQNTIPFSLDTASLSALEILNKVVLAINSYSSDLQALVDQLTQLESEVDTLKSRVDALEVDVENKYLYVLGLIQALKDLIKSIKASELQWDCQHGVYTDTMTAQRNMFNDVTVHGITCEDLPDTVASVDALSECGLNTRGLAVMGWWLKEHFNIPDYFMYTESEG